MTKQIHPDPWNFHNTDKKLLSPDGQYKLVYYELNEIAMGAPLGGLCFLESKEKGRIKINDWCGGPPVWEKEGRRFAIPVWTRTLQAGTIQKIGMVDLQNMELKIFSKTFRVLNLISFDKNIISGVDSPIHLDERVLFDIDKEKIESIRKLTN